jgi:hypothetical protein
MKGKLYMRLFFAISVLLIGNYASAYGVTVYRHAHHNEKIYVGSEGHNDIGEGYYNIAEFENDAISSVKVSWGYQLTLFEHPDYKGKTWTYTADNPWIGHEANDKASAFRVLKTSNSKVSVYLDTYFGGTRWDYSLGDYQFIPNDLVSSLNIPSGWLVVLYEHANFEGEHKVFTSITGYVGNDFNDRASSMRIIDNSAAGDWGGFEAHDISCVNGSYGESYVQYKERLWNLRGSWEESCRNKGAWIDGEWRERPTVCAKDNNFNTIIAIAGGVGLFTPFLPGKFLDLASYSSIASSSLTFAKDAVPLANTTFSTGIWGSFLIRKDSQCNTLYSQQVRACLGAHPPSSGNRVWFQACDAATERTQFARRGETFRYDPMDSEHGELCLDSDYSGNVYLHQCNGSNYQNWELFNSVDGAALYRSRQTGLCLDGDGWRVYTHQCHGGTWQQWK